MEFWKADPQPFWDLSVVQRNNNKHQVLETAAAVSQ